MDPNRLNYYQSTNGLPYDRMGPNNQNINQWQNYPNGPQTLTWEPYAISSPRTIITPNDQLKTDNTKIDEGNLTLP